MGGGWLEGRAGTVEVALSHLLSQGKGAAASPTEGMFPIDFMNKKLGLRRVKLFLLTFLRLMEHEH